MKILLIWFCFFIRNASKVIYSFDLDSVFVSTQHNVKCYGSIKKPFLFNASCDHVKVKLWNMKCRMMVLYTKLSYYLYIVWQLVRLRWNIYTSVQFIFVMFMFSQVWIIISIHKFYIAIKVCCCIVCNMYVASFNKKFQFLPCAIGIVKIHILE